MVKIASAHTKDLKNIRFKHGNAEDLLFKDEFVDLIVSTGSFHH
ncbi:MAG: class I SAM-dependent methyltransferase [Promethearchaeota archaeon]